MNNEEHLDGLDQVGTVPDAQRFDTTKREGGRGGVYKTKHASEEPVPERTKKANSWEIYGNNERSRTKGEK